MWPRECRRATRRLVRRSGSRALVVVAAEFAVGVEPDRDPRRLVICPGFKVSVKTGLANYRPQNQRQSRAIHQHHARRLGRTARSNAQAPNATPPLRAGWTSTIAADPRLPQPQAAHRSPQRAEQSPRVLHLARFYADDRNRPPRSARAMTLTDELIDAAIAQLYDPTFWTPLLAMCRQRSPPQPAEHARPRRHPATPRGLETRHGARQLPAQRSRNPRRWPRRGAEARACEAPAASIRAHRLSPACHRVSRSRRAGSTLIALTGVGDPRHSWRRSGARFCGAGSRSGVCGDAACYVTCTATRWTALTA